MSNQNRLILPGVIVALTLTLCLLIATDLFPLLRGPLGATEWRWQYVSPPDWVPWKVTLPLAVTAAIGLWAYQTRKTKRLNKLHIFSLVALALGFRLVVLETSVKGAPIIARVLNTSYQGYFPPATHIDDIVSFLHNYAEIQSTLPYPRLVTHPPGNTVYYWIIVQAMRAFTPVTQLLSPLLAPHVAQWPPDLRSYALPDVMAGLIVALLVPTLSALSIWPLYLTAELLFDTITARLAVILFIFVPALSLFTPVTDDLYTFIAALALWAAASGMIKGSRWRLGLAGLLSGASLFQSLSTVPMVVALGLAVCLHSLTIGHQTAWRSLRNPIVYALGVPVLWLSIWLVFGLNPIKVFINCLNNYEARLRSYWLSVVYNPWDLILFAGVAVAVHFLLAVCQMGLRLFRREPITVADSVLLGFLGAIVLLIAGGSLRGETARTLLFVYPFVALFAARNVAENLNQRPYYPALLVLSMSVQTVIFQATLAVYH